MLVTISPVVIRFDVYTVSDVMVYVMRVDFSNFNPSIPYSKAHVCLLEKKKEQ